MVSSKSTAQKRNPRTANSFQRRPQIYKNNETILIVCEGETEVNYFNALKREYRLSFLTVKLCETGSAPIRIVEYAIEFAENNEAIDQVFCVFDRDQHSTYEEAIARIENYKPAKNAKSTPVFKAIASIPCFEIWLLLHFQYTAKPYSQKGNVSPGAQIQKELRKHLPEYLKSSLVWFPKLHQHVATALINAARLKKENQNTGSQNPATDVHELVGCLTRVNSLKN